MALSFRQYAEYAAALMTLLPEVLALVQALAAHGVPKEDIDDVVVVGLRTGLAGVRAALEVPQGPAEGASPP